MTPSSKENHLTPENKEPLKPSEEKAAWGIVDPKLDPVEWFREHLKFG